MRISDWSSDVCSSDLGCAEAFHDPQKQSTDDGARYVAEAADDRGRESLERDDCPHSDGNEQDGRDQYDGDAAQGGAVDESKGDHRSEERRVGEESVSTCRSRGWPCHKNKKIEK